ncbi:putative nucleotidyltransferase component of viral defense system [Dyadobacter jejuensis]|uniref:Putative nucleotidyltransferase component of viral defense system n=1 Tax=Dyadobacter jejuensis TaxID=1082580 RepID=A0A316AGU7_9BACT|nr:nucleotidyl transferase AbiEii/AbiGii toxin family protein [Dyadobacter jejuensis]PWJ56509.1 putative nucleotidyltransferase component of viral defense system [Dyadobacter jejuensis]
MENRLYKRQVGLLLDVLPEVAKENCFALHGGTAINLFVRNMPRLSVDIDLTYLPIEDRETSLRNIGEALERIQGRIENTITSVRVQHKKEIAKLLISSQGAEIKLEVNLVGRGSFKEPVKMRLCERAQEEFDVFAAISVVPFGQLFGGKICAALDRQHPRDLFDVKYLLSNEGFSDEVRQGFLFCLLGSDRPINEVIMPNFQDQRLAMVNQFSGMSAEEFSYEEYEAVREQLVKTVNEKLTKSDKAFLLSFKNAEPDWSIYDFERFPSIQWKLRNLNILKQRNPEKHREQYELLKEKLG